MNLNIRLLASVKRWPVVHTIQQQSVAEHTALIALVADNLMTTTGLGKFIDHGAVIIGCVRHDLKEVITGDLPSPVNSHIKAALGENWRGPISSIGFHMGLPNDNVDPKVRLVVRYADLIESVHFLMQEELLGNKLVGDCRAALEASSVESLNALVAEFPDLTQDLGNWHHKTLSKSTFVTVRSLGPNHKVSVTAFHGERGSRQDSWEIEQF